MKELRGSGSPLALAVLALLNERAMHPYEMAFTMRDRHLEAHIKLNYGTLYHTVENLHQMGWIEPAETSRDGRRPERTVYRLTDSGREGLRTSLTNLLAEPAKEYSRLEAGLCFMHNLTAAEAAELLERRAGKLESQLGELRFVYRVLRESRGLGRLSLLEAEFAIARQESELSWVRKLVAEISGGMVEWVAGRREMKDEVKAE